MASAPTANRPARLETSSSSVHFHTGNDVFPTMAVVNYDGGPSVAIGVASDERPREGLVVVITIDDARRMRTALDLVLQLADLQGAA